LSSCQICRYQVMDDSVTVCPNCGAQIGTAKVDPQEETTPEIHLQDVHAGSETNSTDRSVSPKGPRPDDQIEICDPGDIIGAAPDSEIRRPRNAVQRPTIIRPKATPLPVTGEQPKAENGPAEALQRLSPEQAEKIRSSLLTNADGPACPEDATALFHKINSRPAGSQPEPMTASDSPVPVSQEEGEAAQQTSSPPASSDTADIQPEAVSPGPHHSPTARKIAYFHRNFIQLTGAHHLNTGEEVVISGHHYLLKPKKLTRQVTILAGSLVIILALFIIGKQVISPTLPGKGAIVGLLVDANGRPISSGVEVALPETGRKAMTDALGFFRFEDVGTGAYTLRIIYPDGSIGTEHASVIGDQVTTLRLGAGTPRMAAATPLPVTESYVSSGTMTAQVSAPPPPGDSPQPQEKSSGRKGTSALKLSANLDDARLTLDGEVLGVGNLVYKKLNPGKHTLTVSRDGYLSWKGAVALKADETYDLAVTLEAVKASTATEPAYSADDFYQSGRNALAGGNAASAIEDFTEAIKLKPSMPDGFTGRAEAYAASGDAIAAEADYVHAAEVYTAQKRYQTAQELLERVLAANKESISAQLALADLYWKQSDNAKTIDAYNKVLKLDKQNFRANFELGKVYFAMANNKEADKRLRKAQEIDPRVPEVYHFLMLNYFARDDFGKVKKAYADFKAVVPEDQVRSFKEDPRFDAIVRIVGEYERP